MPSEDRRRSRRGARHRPLGRSRRKRSGVDRRSAPPVRRSVPRDVVIRGDAPRSRTPAVGAPAGTTGCEGDDERNGGRGRARFGPRQRRASRCPRSCRPTEVGTTSARRSRSFATSTARRFPAGCSATTPTRPPGRSSRARPEPRWRQSHRIERSEVNGSVGDGPTRPVHRGARFARTTAPGIRARAPMVAGQPSVARTAASGPRRLPNRQPHRGPRRPAGGPRLGAGPPRRSGRGPGVVLRPGVAVRLAPSRRAASGRSTTSSGLMRPRAAIPSTGTGCGGGRRWARSSGV